MKKAILIFFIATISTMLMADNHGLLIGVSSYPIDSGWKKLSSHNDIELLKSSFPERWTIQTLEDEQATRSGILTALDRLCSDVSVGDTVLVHFSGHGQQMLPLPGDVSEADLLDEALVPYDAKEMWSESYDGRNHIRDHELARRIDSLRDKVGKSGFVLVTLDSCHSDSMEKGDQDESKNSDIIYRGTSEIFGQNPTDEDLKNRYKRDTSTIAVNDNSHVVYISACQSNSKNAETNIGGIGYGSLSFSISEVLKDQGLKDIGEFVDGVIEEMHVIQPYQTPGIRASFQYKQPEFKTTPTPESITLPEKSNHLVIYVILGLVLVVFCIGVKKRLRQ